MSGSSDNKDSVSKEFAIYFICVLAISAFLFKFLEITGIPIVERVLGDPIHGILVSLLPSVIAIGAIWIGGSVYKELPNGDDGKDINNLDMYTVGDSCYYMGFLLTLWGLF